MPEVRPGVELDKIIRPSLLFALRCIDVMFRSLLICTPSFYLCEYLDFRLYYLSISLQFGKYSNTCHSSQVLSSKKTSRSTSLLWTISEVQFLALPISAHEVFNTAARWQSPSYVNDRINGGSARNTYHHQSRQRAASTQDGFTCPTSFDRWNIFCQLTFTITGLVFCVCARVCVWISH